MITGYENKPIGTLCFLSDNRLEHVVTQVKAILKEFAGEWRCLIVTGEIKRNKALVKDFRKLCQSSNMVEHLEIKKGLEFQRIVPEAFKVLSAINSVKTKYFSFVDLDHSISLAGLRKITILLSEKKAIGAIRGSVCSIEKHRKIAKNPFQSLEFKPGTGIENFGLCSFSSIGVFYNKKILVESKILERFEANLRAHRDYPLVCLNILLAANFSTCFSPIEVFIKTGDNYSFPDKMSEYFSWHSFGQRCDQLIALRNTIFEGFVDVQKLSSRREFFAKGFYASYIELYRKMIDLIIIENKEMYLDQMMSIDLTARSFSMFCLSAVEQFPEYKFFEKALKEAIVFNPDQTEDKLIMGGQDLTKRKKFERSSVFYSRA